MAYQIRQGRLEDVTDPVSYTHLICPLPVNSHMARQAPNAVSWTQPAETQILVLSLIHI